MVGYIDHQTGEKKSHVLHPHLEVDDHDNPALLFSPEGKLMVFYARHSKADPIFLAVATQPENIEQWEPVRSLYVNDTAAYAGRLNSYTYTNPCWLSTEGDTLHLFWRGMDFKPNYTYSPDGGKTWATGEIFIRPENIYRNRRPYLKVSSNGKDRIHFAFTDGHPRNEPTNSIYYARYERGHLYQANGKRIASMKALPIEPRQADVVYDARETEEKAWIWDVAEDSAGMPVIVYATFPDDQHHVYQYARWDGDQWLNHRLTEAGGWFPQTQPGKEERESNYSGGLVLDHEDPNVVYLSREINGVFEIEQWKTQDGGESWERKALTEGSQQDQIRPFAVRNADAGQGIPVLWLSNRRYIHYTDYESSIQMPRRQ